MSEHSLLRNKTVGLAMTGSFCTFARTFEVAELLTKEYGAKLLPIMSGNAGGTDTRFGSAAEHRVKLSLTAGRDIIDTIAAAEPIGPENMTDIMLVAPCTGNTLAKLANAVTDTPVAMAVKSHVRGGKPVVIALATNDALAGSAKNLGALLNTRGYYFVPLDQDDPVKKPDSLVARFEMIPAVLEAALQGRQLKPLFY